MRKLVGKRMIVSKQDMVILAERSSEILEHGKKGEVNGICIGRRCEGILKPFGGPQLQKFSQACAQPSYIVSHLPNPVSEPACVCLRLLLNIYVPAG
jgi:hypothetical protein